MIVEFIGAPGSGKTTLLPTVIELLAEQGVQGRRVIDAARPFARRTLPGWAVNRLAPPSLRSPLLWQTFYRLSFLFRLRFFARHPRLIYQVVDSQRRRPVTARIKERRVLYWFFHTAGYYEFLSAYARADEALLFDEGFIHRVVQLNASEAEEPRMEAITAYVDLLPRPDLVIFIQAPPAQCLARIQQRGVWQHFQGVTPENLSKFVANAHWVVNHAVEHVRAKGWAVIEVDNGNRDLSAAQSELRRHFLQFINSQTRYATI